MMKSLVSVKALISFGLGLVFLVCYVTLGKFLGNILTNLIILALALIFFIIYLKSQIAPSSGFWSFLEAYAQGKYSVSRDLLSGSKKKSRESYSAEKYSPENPRIDKDASVPWLKRPGALSQLKRIFESNKTQLAAAKSSPEEKRVETIKGTLDSSVKVHRNLIPPPVFMGDLRNTKSNIKEHNLAYENIARGSYQEAQGYLEKLVRKFPLRDTYLNDLAVLYYYFGKIDDAYSQFQKASFGPEKNAILLYNLGLVLKRKKRYKDAFIRLEESIALRENSFAYYHLASLYSLTGQYEECLRQLEKSKAMGLAYQEIIQTDDTFKEVLEKA